MCFFFYPQGSLSGRCNASLSSTAPTCPTSQLTWCPRSTRPEDTKEGKNKQTAKISRHNANNCFKMSPAMSWQTYLLSVLHLWNPEMSKKICRCATVWVAKSPKRIFRLVTAGRFQGCIRFKCSGPSFHREIHSACNACVKGGKWQEITSCRLTLSMVATSSRMMVVMCRTTIPASINIVAFWTLIAGQWGRTHVVMYFKRTFLCKTGMHNRKHEMSHTQTHARSRASQMNTVFKTHRGEPLSAHPKSSRKSLTQTYFESHTVDVKQFHVPALKPRTLRLKHWKQEAFALIGQLK